MFQPSNGHFQSSENVFYIQYCEWTNETQKGAKESVCIEWVEFRENVKAFFPQGLSKLFIIMGCPH